MARRLALLPAAALVATLALASSAGLASAATTTLTTTMTGPEERPGPGDPTCITPSSPLRNARPSRAPRICSRPVSRLRASDENRENPWNGKCPEM